VGLDAADYDKWLTEKNGRYYVPNTIYAEWGGADVLKAFDFSVGQKAVLWKKDVGYLEERGFKVIEEDANEFRPGNLTTILGVASDQKMLHGIFFWGHGDPTVMYNKDAKLIATYQSINKAIEYKMGFVMLNACFSDHKTGDENIEFWFPNKPFQVQVFTGPLVAGGHDLVSQKSIFRGAKGILSPFQRIPVFNEIKHNFVFSHHWHPADALKPGDQETKR
jgi:hypothetical protein